MAGTVTNNDVKIPFEGNEIKAVVVTPQSVTRPPAVIVIHEWWGLNAHVRDVANRLALEGFLAIAPDLFDGRVTSDPQIAGSMMMGLSQERALAKLDAVVCFVRQAGSEMIGVMGYCMGGSHALMLSIHDLSVAASVPFYGQVPGDDILEGLNSPVLYIYAGKDQWITEDEVNRLDRYLQKKGQLGEVVRYPECDHAFFNDTREEVYDESNAADAWGRAVDFLTVHLR